MWYYSVNGQSLGPVSEADLDAQVRSGALPANVYVWKDGMTEWLPYNARPATASSSRRIEPEAQAAAGTADAVSSNPAQGSSLRLESVSSWATLAVVFIAMFGFLGVLSSRPRLADRPFGASQTADDASDDFRANVRLRLGSLTIKNNGGFDWPETQISFQSEGKTYTHKIESLTRGETASIPLKSFTTQSGSAYEKKLAARDPSDFIIDVQGHGAAVARLSRRR